jgi:nicotinamide-nucleotide amidase
LDTNSQWISARLAELGVEVVAHATAADQLDLCGEVFRAAIGRVDIIVATGGLGPTEDDLTREAIAAATDTRLIQDDAALAAIRDLFARRGREMPARNIRQAMFPEGSRAIANPHGSAPGVAFRIPRPGRMDCQLFALPGVPAELFEMWEQTVAPAIVEFRPAARVVASRRIKCFGVGESDLEQMLPDLIRRGRTPSVGITVHQATITLRVTAAGPDRESCWASMAETIETIRNCLGDLVFGEEDDELEHAVLRLLAKQGKTLATVEAGTAGLLARWLSTAHQSNSYRGGLTCPELGAAAAVLGVEVDRWPKSKQLIAEAARRRTLAPTMRWLSATRLSAPQARPPSGRELRCLRRLACATRHFRPPATPQFSSPGSPNKGSICCGWSCSAGDGPVAGDQ